LKKTFRHLVGEPFQYFMKDHLPTAFLAILFFGIITAAAQPNFGGGQAIPGSGAGMEKLFGSNQTFSATTEIQTKSDGDAGPTSISGKIYFDKGSSRFEMDMSEVKGGNMPPNAAAQMKSMGLDHMVTISPADKKAVYLIYPNVQSYLEITPADASATATNAAAKVEFTKLGEESAAGHPCIKNKAVVTDAKGAQHEFTVWNATDLKDFPVKIETEQQGNTITMTYSSISFFKPEAALFNPPASYNRYDNIQDLIQQVMIKRMGLPQPVPVAPQGN
jgi:hypothetical protein